MDCLFCRIVSKEIPSETVYEDDKIYAFKDINPEAPVHILVVPKLHIDSLSTASENHLELLGYMQLKIAEIAKNANITEKGYRVVTNIGVEAGQTVDHLHYHIIGGRPMEWPPG